LGIRLVFLMSLDWPKPKTQIRSEYVLWYGKAPSVCLLSFQRLLKTEIYGQGNTSSIPIVGHKSHFQISKKNPFLISGATIKLRSRRSVFSLVFLLSLLDLTFWPKVGLLNMTFGWCSGDEGLGPRGDFSCITPVFWKLTSVMGLSEADLKVWRLVHCVPAAKHRYRIVIIATYAWCLAKA